MLDTKSLTDDRLRSVFRATHFISHQVKVVVKLEARKQLDKTLCVLLTQLSCHTNASILISYEYYDNIEYIRVCTKSV